jgi:hypothetical protein
MQKIETVKAGDRSDERHVNALLEDGWKIISVTSAGGAVGPTHSITPCFLIVLEKEK